MKVNCLFLLFLLLITGPALAGGGAGPGNMIATGSWSPGDCAVSLGSLVFQAGSCGGGPTAPLYLGTSSSVANPQRSNDATTGLFSSVISTVSIAVAGVEQITANTTGVGIGSSLPRSIFDISQNSGAIILPVGITAARPTPAINGMLRYNSTSTPTIEAYVNNTWTSLGSGGGAITLGTSASATNPQRSGDATTGLYSSVASTVSIAAAGTTLLTIGPTLVNIPLGTAAGTYQGSLQFNGFNAIWQDPVNDNVVIGSSRFPTNVTTGNQNMAMGINALASNTTGAQNTAMGVFALLSNTSGGTNTAVGNYTLQGNTTGDRNVAIGGSALTLNQTGHDNTALNGAANALGSYNTVIGSFAAGGLKLGYSNTVIGYGVAFNTLQTGQNNILIGTDTSTDTITSSTSNSMNIGNVVYGSNLYNSSNGGNVLSGLIGINSSSPRAVFDLSQNTDAEILPVGTTTQRPTGVNGMVRYNSTLTLLEGFVRGIWQTMASGSAGTPTCGSGCSSITAGSTDTIGTATTGAAVTSVTINFSAVLPAAPRTCLVSDNSVIGFASVTTGPSTSAFTIGLSSALTGAIVAWNCFM